MPFDLPKVGDIQIPPLEIGAQRCRRRTLMQPRRLHGMGFGCCGSLGDHVTNISAAVKLLFMSLIIPHFRKIS